MSLYIAERRYPILLVSSCYNCSIDKYYCVCVCVCVCNAMITTMITTPDDY